MPLPSRSEIAEDNLDPLKESIVPLFMWPNSACHYTETHLISFPSLRIEEK